MEGPRSHPELLGSRWRRSAPDARRAVAAAALSPGGVGSPQSQRIEISNIIENSEKLLYDLAEKGSFSSSLIKFDDAMKQTIEMASAS